MPQKTLLSMSYSGHTSKRAYGTTSGSYTYGQYCKYGPFTTTCSDETIYYYQTDSLYITQPDGHHITTSPIICACYNANMEQVKCPPCVLSLYTHHYINIRPSTIS